MKCYNEDCTEYPTQVKNKCVADAGVQMCEGFMPEKDITIANLRAELKLYKRVADMMAEKLEHNKLNEISSCHDYDCRKDTYNSSEDSGPCIKCMIDHYKSEAKEGQ